MDSYIISSRYQTVRVPKYREWWNIRTSWFILAVQSELSKCAAVGTESETPIDTHFCSHFDYANSFLKRSWRASLTCDIWGAYAYCAHSDIPAKRPQVLSCATEVKWRAGMKYSKSQGRVSKVKKMLTAPAIIFPAKDPILFGSDLHFLPQRLTGTETYWARRDVHCKTHLNVLSANVGEEVSVPQPTRGATVQL